MLCALPQFSSNSLKHNREQCDVVTQIGRDATQLHSLTNGWLQYVQEITKRGENDGLFETINDLFECEGETGSI